MNRKITKLLQSNLQVYFLAMILFTALMACYSLPVALGQLAIIMALGLYNRQTGRKRRREISKYLDNMAGSGDTATRDTMTNAPLPMIMFRPESGEIIWANDRFLQIHASNIATEEDSEDIYNRKLSYLVPGFETRWIMEGRSSHPNEVEFGGRRYLVFGQLARTTGRSGSFIATTYWVDVTDMSMIRDRYHATRPVAAVLLIDNYDELIASAPEDYRRVIPAQIDLLVRKWGDSFKSPVISTRDDICPLKEGFF